jgi:hypothetical protein
MIEIILEFAVKQGIPGTVLLIVCYLLYRQQEALKSQAEQHAQESKRNALLMQGMIDNQRQESKQQGEMLDVLMMQVSGTTGIVASVEALKTDLLEKAEEISKKAGLHRAGAQDVIRFNTETLKSNTESVDAMQEKIDQLQSAITEALDAMSQKLDNLQLSPEARNGIVKELTEGIEATMKKCLQEAIRSTQEVPKALPPIPKRTTSKIEDKPTEEQEKTEL